MLPKGVQIAVTQRAGGDFLGQHLMVAEEGITPAVPGLIQMANCVLSSWAVCELPQPVCPTRAVPGWDGMS